MTYTVLVGIGVVFVILIDVGVLRTRRLASASFWLSYAIVLCFQLLTNGTLTGREVVRYNDESIIGSGNEVASPAFLGDGRIAYAPVEDLAFGFAFVLLTVSVWCWLGRVGVQSAPRSGPPRWRSDPEPGPAAGPGPGP